MQVYDNNSTMNGAGIELYFYKVLIFYRKQYNINSKTRTDWDKLRMNVIITNATTKKKMFLNGIQKTVDLPYKERKK